MFQEALAATGELMLSLQRNATRSSAISEYLRALKTLEVHSSELRGRLAMAGDAGQRRSAFNWFSSAADRQLRPSLLMPPSILYPVENRLAEYFIATGEFRRAAETYQKALMRRPNDLATLLGYQQALLKMERRLDAATIQKQIDRVLGKKVWQGP
jgi:tetratricopeptide (TPR) repeat protein